MLVAILWVGTAVAWTAGFLAWRRRALPGAITLLLLLVCIAHGCLSYSLGLLASSLAGKVAWNHVEYLTAWAVPSLLLAFALQHTRQERWLRGLPLALLLAVPVAAWLANWTNEWHHLYYRSERLETYEGAAFLIKDRGPIWWLFELHGMAAATAASALLLRHWLRMPGYYRRRAAALLVASVIPLGLNLLYLLRLGPWHRATLAYPGLVVTGALLGWALLRGRLLDLRPISRAALMENMSEAVLALDEQGRITDFNRRAAEWFGCSAGVLGRRLADLPGWERLVLGETSTSATETLGSRWLRLSAVPLGGVGEARQGWICLARDMTRQRKTERALRTAFQRLRAALREASREWHRATAEAAQIQEQEQRRIGRDIHDTLCQDLAALSRRTESAAAQAERLDAGRLGPELRQVAAEAAQVLRSARGFAYDLAQSDLGDLCLPDALAAFAERAQAWLGTQVDVNFSPDVQIEDAETSWHMLRIVREAVFNAARHGRARRAWVDVIRRDGQITLSVSNDGAALPAQEAIQPGLGLRGMQMRARLLGGELSLRNAGPGGVTVQLRLPEMLLRLPVRDRLLENRPPPL